MKKLFKNILRYFTKLINRRKKRKETEKLVAESYKIATLAATAYIAYMGASFCLKFLTGGYFHRAISIVRRNKVRAHSLNSSGSNRYRLLKTSKQKLGLSSYDIYGKKVYRG